MVSSRINHNEGAENARRQTDEETGLCPGVAVGPSPCPTAHADVPEQRPSLPRRNWQPILQTWRTRFSQVLLFAEKRVVDPLHGPIRGSREKASAILKTIPTRNRKAIAAQLFFVSGSQNQIGSSIFMARTTKGLLRLKSGVIADPRILSWGTETEIDCE